MLVARLSGVRVALRPSFPALRGSRLAAFLLLALAVGTCGASPLGAEEHDFVRGDINDDGLVDPIGDAIFVLGYGFNGGPPPHCADAADANDDGLLDPIGDAIFLLGYGFTGGPAPPLPFPDCGSDTTADALDCAGPTFCGPTNFAPEIISTPVLEATEGELYEYDVEATDADAGDTLSYSLLQAPAGMGIDAATGLIAFTPAPEQSGQVFVVEIRVEDSTLLADTQLFDLTVIDVNRPPAIVSDPPLVATEGSPYAYDAEATDADPGDTLVWSLALAPAGATIDPATGLVEWTPSSLRTGAQEFTVTVTDDGSPAASDSQSFTVIVEDINLAPQIVSAPPLEATEGAPYAYDADATDPDPTDTLTWSLALAPAGATIDPATGLVEWTPSSLETGPQEFVVAVTDDGVPVLGDSQSFTVVVADLNFAPTIVSSPALDATEGTPYSYDADATDVDPTDTLTWSLALAPAGATIDPATGLVAWTPSSLETGPQEFTVEVADDGVPALSDSQSFTVVVADLNFAPTITSVPPLDATEDAPYLYDAEATDVDPNDTLVWSFAAAPEGATIDPATGLVEWTPSSLQTGPQSFTVVVTDDGTPPGGASQTFTVTVADVNLSPAIVSAPPLGATAGELYLYDVAAEDEDPGDLLTYSLPLAPLGATIDPGSGLIEWTPVTAQLGPQEFTVMVTDDGTPTAVASQSFTVDVVPPVNIAPTISSCPDRGALVGDLVECSLEGSDANRIDTLTFSLPVAPPGAAIDPATGAFAWTPALADAGPNPITVRVTDDGTPPLFAETSFVATVVEPGSVLWRIDAGGSAHTDTLGRTWSADTGCAFGCTNTSSTTSPIAGAADPTLYRSHRWFAGDFRYSLPVLPGIGTTVRLHFANIFAGTSSPGTRVFDVAIEGFPVLVGFDIAAVAGHLAAHIEEISVPATDGVLDLDFLVGAANNPLVSGIEVLAGPPENEAPVIYSLPPSHVLIGTTFEYDAGAYDPNGDELVYSLEGTPPASATIDPASGLVAWTPTAADAGTAAIFTVRATDPSLAFDEQTFALPVIDPVPGAVVHRVNCGGPEIADTPLVWEANPGTGEARYVNTGNTTTNAALAFLPDLTVPAATPLALFSTERWDPPAAPEMTWTLPIGLPGDYEVRLYFSENFATAQVPAFRFFDVLLEGALVLDDFDVFVEAGGIVGGATMRSSIATVSDGALTIDFLHAPGGNNPSIKAIEVLVAP